MWIEKHGPGFRIRDLAGGRKVTLKSGYATKTAAKAALVHLKADALRGEGLVPRGGEMTLNDWLDAWWPLYAASLKPTSARTEGSRVRNHLRPLLGHLTLDQIDPMTVLRWVGQLTAGGPGRRPLAPKTIRNVHGVLHKVLDEAVRQKLIRINPATGTGMPPRQYHEMRFLTAPEIDRLLAAAGDFWRPLVMLLVSTGLRYGEAIGLKVKNIDVLAGVLRVEEAMHEAGGGRYVFTEPKSRASRRAVTIPPDVAAELVPLVANRDRDDLVFTSPNLPHVTRNFRIREWARIIARAELPGLRIHDLRHTHATLLISAGVPLTAIQRRMGHTSIRVTSDMYGHLLPEVDDKIMSAVSAALPGRQAGGTMGETIPAQPGASRSIAG